MTRTKPGLMRANSGRWRKANPEKQKASEKRWRLANADFLRASVRRRRLATFGITPDDFDRLFSEQNGRCAICFQPEPRKRQDGSNCELAVDHCHVTDVVRGLLCKDCNLVLGNAHDEPGRLRQAALYLEKHISQLKDHNEVL